MLFLVTLGIAAPQITLEQQKKATANARILVSGRASKAEWEATSPLRRKDMLVSDGRGKKIRVRIIDYE